jgi:hypothetical protein
MGNIESYYQVVPDKIVKKVVGSKAVKDYLDKLELLKDSDSQICDSAVHGELEGNGYGTIDAESKEWLDFKKAYEKVCDTFTRKTGLDLYALYTEGDGDCYDDLRADTWYWAIPEREVWVRKTTEKADEFMKKYGNSAIDTDQRFSIYG